MYISKNSITLAITVAIAAPATPNFGNPANPYIKSKFKTVFIIIASALISVGAFNLCIALELKLAAYDNAVNK